MTIEISYDGQAGCYVGHESTRDLFSAGTTWQRAIAATVNAVEMRDRWMALTPAERRARVLEQRMPRVPTVSAPCPD